MGQQPLSANQFSPVDDIKVLELGLILALTLLKFESAEATMMAHVCVAIYCNYFKTVVLNLL